VDTIAPPGMNTAVGATVSFDASLLASSILIPPGGAGSVRLTGTATDWLGPTDKFPGRTIAPDAAFVLVSRKAAELDTPGADAVTT
jgi:hypothetical protein